MKKAFTLIELVVAIGVFSVLIVYMYQAIATTKKSTSIYEKMYEKADRISLIKKIIYNDIFNQVDPYTNTQTITEKDFSTYYLRTNNSLNALASPYVAYKVIKGNLYRFESTAPFKLPFTYETKLKLKIDKILENVERFVIHTNKNSKLIDMISNEQRTFFEISLPYSRKVIVVGG